MRCELRWRVGAALVASLIPSAAAGGQMTLVDKGHAGRVVELGTGKPIPGAKVVGQWMVGYSSPAHGGQRCVKALVVETDSAGKFRLPPWSRDDTGVDGLGLAVYAYKPGYRATKPVPSAGARPSVLGRIAGLGEVQIEGVPFEVTMEPWSGDAQARADYLFDLLPSVGCVMGDRAEWGSLYFLHRAVLEEAKSFPPSVKVGPYPDFSSFLKPQLERSRAKLQSERPEWREGRE